MAILAIMTQFITEFITNTSNITAIIAITAVMAMTNIISILQSAVTYQANSANSKLLGFLRNKYNGHYITGLNKPV